MREGGDQGKGELCERPELSWKGVRGKERDRGGSEEDRTREEMGREGQTGR